MPCNGSGNEFFLNFQFWSKVSDCVIVVHQGAYEQVFGKPVTESDYNPENPLRIQFVPLKKSVFEIMEPIGGKFSANS